MPESPPALKISLSPKLYIIPVLGKGYMSSYTSYIGQNISKKGGGGEEKKKHKRKQVLPEFARILPKFCPKLVHVQVHWHF